MKSTHTYTQANRRSPIYKGIVDYRGTPISLREVVSLYKSLVRTKHTSMERVAEVLTAMGYKSKLGGPVNRHQVFRAIMRDPDGADVIRVTREKVGTWM